MSRFKLEYFPKELELRDSFGISRETKKTVTNIFLKLSADGLTGLGEAAPNKRYDETPAEVSCFFDQLSAGILDNVFTPADLKSVLKNEFSSKSGVPNSALAALEMAWLDWWGKKQGKPLWQLWEMTSRQTPPTSFTVGLDEIAKIQQKVKDAGPYPVLKIKLGTPQDREIIKAVRQITNKPLRVDANEGWKTLDEAKAMVRFLGDYNIQFIEQPMPAGQFSDMITLKKYSAIPLCADESFKGNESLAKISSAFDIINIKLMKTGSLLRARQIIEKAHEHKLKVMIGCMIESSVAISAGAVLGVEADYIDLDGNLLISNDPTRGLTILQNSQIELSDQPGLGVRFTDDRTSKPCRT